MRSELDVFEISRGLPLAGWKTARWLYRHGASSRLIGALYNRFRQTNDYNRRNLLIELMGRDIRKRLSDTQPVVVSHPSLVGMLTHRANLIYQHGGLVVPDEARVLGASLVIVPTQQTAERFLDAGYQPERVFVSGLCIEPPLVRQAEEAYRQRRLRVDAGGSLAGAFFSSGAEPRAHVETIVRAAASAVVKQGKIVIFAQRHGRLANAVATHFRDRSMPFLRLDSSSQIPALIPSALLVEFASRREENILTARFFTHFDYLAAPSHERTNWAMGLGLPMFIVGPSIGPFSPLNRALLLEHGVGIDIEREQCDLFGELISRLVASKRLVEMIDRGWGILPIDGFERIADELIRRFGE